MRVADGIILNIGPNTVSGTKTRLVVGVDKKARYRRTSFHSHLDFTTAAQTIFYLKIWSPDLWRGFRFINSSLVTMRQNSQMIHLSIGQLVTYHSCGMLQTAPPA